MGEIARFERCNVVSFEADVVRFFWNVVWDFGESGCQFIILVSAVMLLVPDVYIFVTVIWKKKRTLLSKRFLHGY